MSPSLLWPDPFSNCHQDHLKIGNKSILSPHLPQPSSSLLSSSQTPRSWMWLQGRARGPHPPQAPIPLPLCSSHHRPACSCLDAAPLTPRCSHLPPPSEFHPFFSSYFKHCLQRKEAPPRPEASVLHSQGATVSASCGCGD